jgi:hypothetical protein
VAGDANSVCADQADEAVAHVSMIRLALELTLWCNADELRLALKRVCTAAFSAPGICPDRRSTHTMACRTNDKMKSPEGPRLRFLHSKDLPIPVKLEVFRRLSTDAIESSLHSGQTGSLKVRTDGTVLDGHHRLSVLLERGVDIDRLPREMTIERES